MKWINTCSTPRIALSTWQSQCYFHDSLHLGKSVLVMLKADLEAAGAGGGGNTGGRVIESAATYKICCLSLVLKSPLLLFCIWMFVLSRRPWGTKGPAWQMAPRRAQEGKTWQPGDWKELSYKVECVFKGKRKQCVGGAMGEIGLSAGKNKRNLKVIVILSNLWIFIYKKVILSDAQWRLVL